MKVDLSNVVDEIEVVQQDLGFPDSIEGFTNDSRRINKGDVFIAIAGTELSGSDFLPDAQEKGAIAAIVDDSLTVPAGVTIPLMRVGDARAALSLLAREYYGDPSRKLLVDAFVGTKGKTTSAYIAKAICEAGFGEGKAGVIGTLGASGGGVEGDAGLTTPESSDLQMLFARFVESGVKQVSIEYTAHAIALKRGRHIHFRTGVFTSFSQDHLDFFGTMEDYLKIKTSFFADRKSDPDFRAVINIDDPASGAFLHAAGGNALTFGTRGRGYLRAENFRSENGGSVFEITYEGSSETVKLDAIGGFNISNALAAVGLGLRHGISLAKIAQGLDSFVAVPGRLEAIREGQPFDVLVDYAHSPESVKVILAAVRELGYKKIITVMGAGGDRDRSKRPIMGQELVKGSDIVIVTSDNPRGENPDAIINDIVAGIENLGAKAEYTVEVNRREAIALAIEKAEPGDVVMILGKGAEDYQEINGVRHRFDDREICRALLRGMIEK